MDERGTRGHRDTDELSLHFVIRFRPVTSLVVQIAAYMSPHFVDLCGFASGFPLGASQVSVVD